MLRYVWSDDLLPDTRHPTPDTRHPTPDTRHPTPDTRHPTPDTRHPTPDMLGRLVRIVVAEPGLELVRIEIDGFSVGAC
jgi:hypothetical protein